MVLHISGSVGSGGQNRSDDLHTVHALFYHVMADPPPDSGRLTQALVQAIRQYQSRFMSVPDGRIDVGMRTWRTLLAEAEAAMRLQAAVGEGGRNRPEDVRRVYRMLNRVRPEALPVSDRVTPAMIDAIRAFQQDFLRYPDGRVDPEGPSWRRLLAGQPANSGGADADHTHHTDDAEADNDETISSSGAGELILSFDDGPAPLGALERILDTLDREGISGEFYVLGSEVARYPAAARAIAERGHRLQNHSWSHPNLATASLSEVRRQLEDTQARIKRVTGVTATKIRPPYGAGGWASNIDPELARVAGELSLKIENWDIDTEDWKRPRGVGADSKVTMIRGQLRRKRGQAQLNVLMHVMDETAEDLSEFIRQLRQWGYTFARP